jgi:hypothetical protein
MASTPCAPDPGAAGPRSGRLKAVRSSDNQPCWRQRASTDAAARRCACCAGEGSKRGPWRRNPTAVSRRMAGINSARRPTASELRRRLRPVRASAGAPDLRAAPRTTLSVLGGGPQLIRLLILRRSLLVVVRLGRRLPRLAANGLRAGLAGPRSLLLSLVGPVLRGFAHDDLLVCGHRRGTPAVGPPRSRFEARGAARGLPAQGTPSR